MRIYILTLESVYHHSLVLLSQYHTSSCKSQQVVNGLISLAHILLCLCGSIHNLEHGFGGQLTFRNRHQLIHQLLQNQTLFDAVD